MSIEPQIHGVSAHVAEPLAAAPSAVELVAAPAPDWLDGRPRVGIHTSIAGELSRALDTAARIGCTALQIFSGSPRMWPRPHQRHIAAPVAKRFRERRAELRLGPVAVHANYLINLASPDPIRWESAVAAFRDEIIRARQLGADYLIVHPGSPRDAGIARGIENVAEAIARASSAAGAEPCVHPPESSLRILIENTAGQGTGLGSAFAHLREILDACRARSVAPTPGVCLDTAHLLAAGFEIHTAEGLDRTLDEVEVSIGLENVCVIHCNDSKAPLAARIDRHQHIGRGHIGKEAFARIVNHPRLRTPDRAFLAETPIDRPGDDRRNVRALWSLLGLEPPISPKSVRRGGPAKRVRPHRRSSRSRRMRRAVAVGASRNRGIVQHSSRPKPHSRPSSRPSRPIPSRIPKLRDGTRRPR